MSFPEIIILVVTASLSVAFFRFLKGPSLSDRAMALDTMAIFAVAIMTLLSFVFDRVIYLDIAIVFALVGFATTILIGRYLEGGL